MHVDVQLNNLYLPLAFSEVSFAPPPASLETTRNGQIHPSLSNWSWSRVYRWYHLDMESLLLCSRIESFTYILRNRHWMVRREYVKFHLDEDAMQTDTENHHHSRISISVTRSRSGRVQEEKASMPIYLTLSAQG